MHNSMYNSMIQAFMTKPFCSFVVTKRIGLSLDSVESNVSFLYVDDV